MTHIAGHTTKKSALEGLKLPPGTTVEQLRANPLLAGDLNIELTGEQAAELYGFGKDSEFPVLGVPTSDYEDRVGTPFTEDSPFRHVQNLDSTKLRRLQDILIGVGLLRAGEGVVPGQLTVNDPTYAALARVMEFANTTGKSLDGALTTLQQQVNAGVLELSPENERFEQGRYFTLPDYETLKRKVISQFRDSLRRDPTQAEMKVFTNELMSGFQESVSVQETMFEEVGAGRDVTVQSVDPESAFINSFEERYRPQMESLEKQEGTATGVAATAANIDAAEREVL